MWFTPAFWSHTWFLHLIHRSYRLYLDRLQESRAYSEDLRAAANRLNSVLESTTDCVFAITADQVLLFCFHYDPATGKYTLGIWRVLQAMCLLTVGMIGGLFIILRRKTREIEARRAGLTKVTSE